MHDSNRVTSFTLQPEQVSNCCAAIRRCWAEIPRKATGMPESSGKRCQVSLVMSHGALWKCSGPPFFMKKKAICS